MRLFITLVALTVMVGLAQSQQGGFFNNIQNALFGSSTSRQTARRPPPRPRQPPQNFGNPQLNTIRRPPPNQRLPPQQFNQQQVRVNPQQQQQVRVNPQQQQVRVNPPQQQFNQPQQVRVNQQQQQVRTVSTSQSNIPCPGSGLNGCAGACPTDTFNNRRYLYTWKLGEKCSNFTGEEAVQYCKQQGGDALSLDSNLVADYFISKAIEDAKRYFWTGGRIDHNAGVVTWPSGAREGYVRGQRYWSPTGGKKPNPEPQPDNRDGNEVCIGVLNNFYADGVKWHDVACHHRKPTICEFRN